MAIDFNEVMAKQTDEQLVTILTTKRSDYIEAALNSAQLEMDRRQISPEQIEEIKKEQKIVQEKVNVKNKSLESIPKGKIRRLLIYSISILFINITLSIVQPTGTTTNLQGQVVSSAGVKQALITTLIVTITAFGFILGLILSLFPYKELSYKKKYLGASLISILALQLFYLLMEVKYLVGIYG
ncbi:MAG: hypothetical protein A3F72_18725 [Bacteroidetes bacterium RIFCSPLOWO2_12_FULL_35_15]|nr:MAG: hypothetical protein A3F72_18725 [Bacteroidetes bacterium RIFCSPLOWO2_12_FULL_35_15]